MAGMTKQTLGSVVAGGAMWLMVPVNSCAQIPATSFDELSRILRSGQEVTVTSTDGHRSRGKVGTLTASTLVLEPPRKLFRRRGPRQSIAESSVTTVTRVDSPWEGMLVGLAAGVVSVAIAGNALPDPYFSPLLIVGAGMGIGGAIDLTRNKIVYRVAAPRAVGGATLSLAPVINSNAKGVLLHFQF